ncbi:hypothetical protein OPQ81_003780 [Rhizoctonia solani]|nr:hypothetical protein OPQ81_003780 [Rhizoctonia solani]
MHPGSSFAHILTGSLRCVATQGKYKKEAWQKNLKELNGNDDPVPTAAAQEAAKKKYAELIEKLKKECGFDENKVPEEVGGN